MAKLLKLRRGNTSQHSSFTGAEGEVTVDTDKETLVVHDGSTAGGHPVAAEDMANVSSASIAGRLGTDSIATTKIAAGALPTDVTIADANISGNLTIESADIVNGTIVDADISGSAAIALSKLATGALPTAITVTSANISDLSIVNADINASAAIALSKLATGALPTGITIASANLVDGTIVNADVNASAAIARTKLANVDLVDDSSPQLGADLDVNDFNIKNGTATIDISENQRIEFNTSGAERLDINDGGIDVTGNITVTGTVDGVDVAAAKTKLDTIETNAKDDQTAAEILSLISGQHIYTSGAIGLDSTDYLQFTNNTQCDFYINGNNEFRFEADGDFHADGDVIAQSTTTASDKKLKENIEVIPNALDKVQALNGVSFDWKKTGEKSAGVIAQEVQAILPEAVKEVTPVGGGDSHLAVNYNALTSILIESIKELKAEIEELKGGK